MQFSTLIRPVLACAAALSVGACGMVEGDPNRFENLAEGVAGIPISLDRPGKAETQARTAHQSGMRPALKVEVMDPHDLWDARDGVVEATVARAAPAVIKAAAPVVVETAAREVEARVPGPIKGLRPAAHAPARLVQLGAFGSRDAAADAWGRIRSGAASRYLADAHPVYEAVQVNGRSLVRLKVVAPSAGAAAVCAAARISDPWCTRGA